MSEQKLRERELAALAIHIAKTMIHLVPLSMLEQVQHEIAVQSAIAPMFDPTSYCFGGRVTLEAQKKGANAIISFKHKLIEAGLDQERSLLSLLEAEMLLEIINEQLNMINAGFKLTRGVK